MKAIILLVLFGTLAVVAGAADVLPKYPLKIEGKSYLYSDYCIITTGAKTVGGVTMHVFLIYPDEPQYSGVALKDVKPFWPDIATPAAEFPAVDHGVYFLVQRGSRVIVRRIAAETPSSTDRKLINAF